LLVLIMSIGLARSQDTAIVTHNHTMNPVIDGSVHPDLIPDLAAYRLWMALVSKPAVPTDSEMKRQNVQLRAAHLSDADQSVLIGTLARFNAQYRKMIRDYNAEATAELAKGNKPDVDSFVLQRDQLVQSTHDMIKASLTSDGWARLDAHIQHEKRQMKLNQKGGQQ
jgi:hypothetical protein